MVRLSQAKCEVAAKRSRSISPHPSPERGHSCPQQAPNAPRRTMLREILAFQCCCGQECPRFGEVTVVSSVNSRPIFAAALWRAESRRARAGVGKAGREYHPRPLLEVRSGPERAGFRPSTTRLIVLLPADRNGFRSPVSRGSAPLL